MGTAGWSLPRDAKKHFPKKGTHLERYAQRFSAVEIDSTFYRPHRISTYERWAASVPESFRFAVKLPRAITHEAQLAGAAPALREFLAGPEAMGEKLGPLLVQLPPSLAFDGRTAGAFFRALRRRFGGPVVCEPRHPSWLEPRAGELLADQRVARVAADPARTPEAREPGGWAGLVYYRLHGSPRRYYSSYPPAFIDRVARRLRSARSRGADVWCIFDNTAAGAGTGDALALLERLFRARGSH